MNSGCQRAWKSTIKCAPACLGGLDHRSASATDVASGFSTSTCLPARSIATAGSRCRWSGVAMVTASTALAGKLVQAGRPGAAESVAGAAGAVGVAIADHRQPRARMRRERERVIAAPDAGADDAHGHGPAGHRHLTRYTPATAGSSNT